MAVPPQRRSAPTPRYAYLLSTSPAKTTITELRDKFRTPSKLFLERSGKRKRPASMPAFSRRWKVASQSLNLVLGGNRSAPAEAIVHADLNGVVVVAEARADDLGGPA